MSPHLSVRLEFIVWNQQCVDCNHVTVSEKVCESGLN